MKIIEVDFKASLPARWFDESDLVEEFNDYVKSFWTFGINTNIKEGSCCLDEYREELVLEQILDDIYYDTNLDDEIAPFDLLEGVTLGFGAQDAHIRVEICELEISVVVNGIHRLNTDNHPNIREAIVNVLCSS